MRISRTVAAKSIDAYARTLYQVGAAEDSVDLIDVDLRNVVTAYRGHAELREALTDETLSIEQRLAVADEVFTETHQAVVKTLGVMVEVGHLDLLGSVAEAYQEIAEAERGLVVVDVTTAVELTDAARDAVASRLSADLGKGVVLREAVDSTILGGIIMRSHGRVVDASIRSQLDVARATLSTAHTGGEA